MQFLALPHARGAPLLCRRFDDLYDLLEHSPFARQRLLSFPGDCLPDRRHFRFEPRFDVQGDIHHPLGERKRFNSSEIRRTLDRKPFVSHRSPVSAAQNQLRQRIRRFFRFLCIDDDVDLHWKRLAGQLRRRERDDRIPTSQPGIERDAILGGGRLFVPQTRGSQGEGLQVSFGVVDRQLRLGVRLDDCRRFPRFVQGDCPSVAVVFALLPLQGVHSMGDPGSRHGPLSGLETQRSRLARRTRLRVHPAPIDQRVGDCARWPRAGGPFQPDLRDHLRLRFRGNRGKIYLGSPAASTGEE